MSRIPVNVRTRAELKAHRAHEQKPIDWLERIHEPPAWMPLGRAITMHRPKTKPGPYRITRTDQWVEDAIRRNDPAAEERLLEHFIYLARRVIHSYYVYRPESPVSWEAIYSTMLARAFPAFVQDVRTKGFPLASSTLFAKRIYLSRNKLAGFETQYVRARDYPGATSPKTRYHRVLTTPHPEKIAKETPESIPRLLRKTTLTPQERKILAWRYGPHPQSQTTIARQLRMTPQNVSLIEKHALESLRSPFNQHALGQINPRFDRTSDNQTPKSLPHQAREHKKLPRRTRK